MNANPNFADVANEAALTGPDLCPWDNGPAVIELQELLRAHGFDIRVDGDFGSVTEAAVRVFQKQHGLVIDGIVDSKTWAALKSTVKGGTRVLKQGDTGADVYELQGLLRIEGYEVKRNGIFDVETEQAAIAFQRRHKLKDNGIVDSITWTMLRNGLPLPTPPKQTIWFLNFPAGGGDKLSPKKGTGNRERGTVSVDDK